MFLFQFTHPGRGATTGEGYSLTVYSGFNSRTPGGVRPSGHTCHTHTSIVSIHAPREGCDLFVADKSNTFFRFNSRTPGGVRPQGREIPYQDCQVSIHAPREGCDVPPLSIPICTTMFQFTHPGRGATVSRDFPLVPISRFNSRTPGGVRLPYMADVATKVVVSIHAPREGCDFIVV